MKTNVKIAIITTIGSVLVAVITYIIPILLIDLAHPNFYNIWHGKEEQARL